MKTIDKIITNVSTFYGAPMGRCNVSPDGVTHIKDHKGKGNKYIVIDGIKKTLFDCAVPMDSSGAYDKGGVYWGMGSSQLRVSYTKDLSYINFYRN